MAFPPQYVPQTAFAALLGGVVPPGKVDVELSELARIINQIRDNQRIIQRSDGKLADSTVRLETLDVSVAAAIVGGWKPRGEWLENTAYRPSDYVSVDGLTYVAASGHTSSTDFATDRAEGRWMSGFVLSVLQARPERKNFAGNGVLTIFNLDNLIENDDVVLVFVNNALVENYSVTPGTFQVQFDAAPPAPGVPNTNNIVTLHFRVVGNNAVDAIFGARDTATQQAGIATAQAVAAGLSAVDANASNVAVAAERVRVGETALSYFKNWTAAVQGSPETVADAPAIGFGTSASGPFADVGPAVSAGISPKKGVRLSDGRNYRIYVDFATAADGAAPPVREVSFDVFDSGWVLLGQRKGVAALHAVADGRVVYALDASTPGAVTPAALVLDFPGRVWLRPRFIANSTGTNGVFRLYAMFALDTTERVLTEAAATASGAAAATSTAQAVLSAASAAAALVSQNASADHEDQSFGNRVASEFAADAARAAAPPNYVDLDAAVLAGLGAGETYFNTTFSQFRIITVGPPDPPEEDVHRSMTGAEKTFLGGMIAGALPPEITASQVQAEAGANPLKAMSALNVSQFEAIRRDTVSARVFGAIGNNITINNAALAAMTAAIVTNFGGQAYLNQGTFRVDGAAPPVILKEATTLIGAGPTASRINAQDMTAGSVISHAPDLGVGNSSFVSVRNILIDEAFDSAIDFVGMDHSVIDFNFIDSTAARTVRGVRLRDTFMMDVANNHIRETSGAGIDIDNVNIAVSTSILLRLNHLKTTGGYRLRRLTYATDLNSGCDDSNSYSRDLQNVNQMTFISPGAERSQRAMFNFEASTAIANGVNSAVQDVRATIIAPVALETGQILNEPGFIRAVSADGREIKVAVIGGYYRRQSGNTAPAVSLSGAGVKVALIGASLDAAVAPSVINGAGLYELDWRGGAFHMEVTGGGVNNAVLELFNKDDAANSGFTIKTGYSNAAARNWGFFTNRHVNGDLCLVQSTTLGGDPSTGANGVTHILLHNGRVAIGKTTAPTVALDVVGAGAFTGALTVAGLATFSGGAAAFSVPTSANNAAALTLASTTDVTNHGLHITSGHANANVRNWALTTNGSAFGRIDFRVGNVAGDSAMVGATSTAAVSFTNTPSILIAGTQVLGTRKTGWAAATGTATRSTFVTSTVTLAVLAEHVKAMIDDFISHGALGA